MKKFYFFPVFIFLILLVNQLHAQDSTKQTVKIVIVVKNDGSEYVGRVLSDNAREIEIETTTIGRIFIPKHEIREIRELKSGDLNNRGEYVGEELFATRYFLTTNGFGVKKGKGYTQWNIFGPDVQFSITDNFGMGIMTSWVGIPIIGSAKYSFELSSNTHFGIGLLAGTGSWIRPDFGILLPFGAMTFGNQKSNINFSFGYGSVFANSNAEGRFLVSVGGLKKVGKNFSLVFDSFIVPASANSEGYAILLPGLRWQNGSYKAFQFGFAGLAVQGELIPIPIPMIQLFRLLN